MGAVEDGFAQPDVGHVLDSTTWGSRSSLGVSLSPSSTIPCCSLIPFSGGPVICPVRHLLLLASTMLAALLSDREVWLKPLMRLDARQSLPGMLNNYSLRFDLSS